MIVIIWDSNENKLESLNLGCGKIAHLKCFRFELLISLVISSM